MGPLVARAQRMTRAQPVPDSDISRPEPGTNGSLPASSSVNAGRVDAGSLVELQKGVGMYVWLALFLIVADVSAAFAQGRQGTPQEQQACSRDASRLCRKDLGNDGAVQSCLQANRTKLSHSCRKVFESHGM
jgi:hypothetical protein